MKIVVIFGAFYLYARYKGPVEVVDDGAADLLNEQSK